jgi:HPt (histidine-containing phosphotransfer) domain-containing protein
MQRDELNSPILSTLADDQDLLELVEMFVAQLPERLSSMQEAFGQADLKRLRQLAHQLKGSGGSHGFAVLTRRAAELEEACKAQAIEKAQAGLQELAALIPRLKARPTVG